MARKAHFILPRAHQYVIQHGHSCESCFYTEEDCYRYCRDLREANEKYFCAFSCQCTQHHPLVIKPGHTNSITHIGLAAVVRPTVASKSQRRSQYGRGCVKTRYPI